MAQMRNPSKGDWVTSILEDIEEMEIGLDLEEVKNMSKKRLKKTVKEKSRIRETKNLSTDADSRTYTVFERLHDLSKKSLKKNGAVDVSTRTRVHATAQRVGDGRSAPTSRF